MAKALNQNFYTSILYGSEAAGSTLTLQSNLTLNAGLPRIADGVAVVGSVLDLVIAGKTGRFMHGNSTTRTYKLPDANGWVLLSSLLPDTGDLLYYNPAVSPLPSALGSIATASLTTDHLGLPIWQAGANGQFLQVVGNQVLFASLPSWVGQITPSTNPLTPSTLPVYQGATNNLAPLTTVSNRTLMSSPAGLSWGLIGSAYLAGAGGVPLTDGPATTGYNLQSNGDGTFKWINDTSVVNPGAQVGYAAYYAAVGTAVSESGFVEFNESVNALSLHSYGRLRFYPSSGTNYIELHAPSSLTSSPSMTLPSSIPPSPPIGSYSVLSTDASGMLSFVTINNNFVNAGIQNQLAWYAATGSTVSAFPSPSGSSKALLSPTTFGAPVWSSITPAYMSISGSANTNYALCSDGAGGFNWQSVIAIGGSVANGNAGYLPYYQTTGSTVQGSSYIYSNDLGSNPGSAFQLQNGASLQLCPTGSSNYISISAPALTGNLSWVLPNTAGANGYALTTNGSGTLSWSVVGSGTVHLGSSGLPLNSTPANLTCYVDATDSVYAMPSVATRVMTTDASGVPTWNLLTESYLNGLTAGVANQVVASNGFGSFQYIDARSVAGEVYPGTTGSVAYYSNNGWNQVSGSSFLTTDNTNSILTLSGGGLQSPMVQFYNASNTHYASLQAGSLTSNLSWLLPTSDASSANQAIVSDGSGNLSFWDPVLAGSIPSWMTVAGGTPMSFYQSAIKQVKPTTSMAVTASGLAVHGTPFTVKGSDDNQTGISLIGGSGGLAAVGGNIILQGGDGVVPGSVSLNVGSSWTAASADTDGSNPFLSIGTASALRFTNGANWTGFKAPAALSSTVVYSLPPSDGSSGYVLTTSGSGTLSWALGGVGTVTAGTVNAIPYYSASQTLTASSLLIPASVPSVAYQAMVVDTLGQISYASLVATGGSPGQLAYYTGIDTNKQSLTYSTVLFDSTSVSLVLPQTALRFSDSSGFYVGFTAPAAVSASYSVELPTTAPVAGQVLTATSSTQLAFVTPATGLTGVITSTPTMSSLWSCTPNLTTGVQSITVTFTTPFSSVPTVTTTWSFGSVTPPVSGGAPTTDYQMPTLAIANVTVNGFMIFLSETPATNNYAIHWQAA